MHPENASERCVYIPPPPSIGRLDVAGFSEQMSCINRGKVIVVGSFNSHVTLIQDPLNWDIAAHEHSTRTRQKVVSQTRNPAYPPNPNPETLNHKPYAGPLRRTNIVNSNELLS